MAQDQQDPGTIDLLGPVTAPRRPRGRPRIYDTKQAQQAAAARAYRARKKAAKAAAKAPDDDRLHSKIIDLSALPAWRRR
jgi:hypothetical protein